MVTPPVFAFLVLVFKGFFRISWGVAIALIVAYSIIGTTIKNQIQ